MKLRVMRRLNPRRTRPSYSSAAIALKNAYSDMEAMRLHFENTVYRPMLKQMAEQLGLPEEFMLDRGEAVNARLAELVFMPQGCSVGKTESIYDEVFSRSAPGYVYQRKDFIKEIFDKPEAYIPITNMKGPDHD